jgi:UrcA family protein
MSVLSRPLAAALLSVSLALPALAAARSPAHEIIVRPAASGVDVRAERVSYADLNLDHPAGARTLLMRINGAAQRVCGTDDGIHGDGGYKACVRKAVDRAVTEVGNPLVISLHQRD